MEVFVKCIFRPEADWDSSMDKILEIDEKNYPENPACPVKYIEDVERSGFNRGKSCLKKKIKSESIPPIMI